MMTKEEREEIYKALQIVEYYENLFLKLHWHLPRKEILKWDAAHEKLASVGLFYEPEK